MASSPISKDRTTDPARARTKRPCSRAADERDELTPYFHFNDLVSAAASGLD
jgi:hypothetical protein